jgi:hypothetical protein
MGNFVDGANTYKRDIAIGRMIDNIGTATANKISIDFKGAAASNYIYRRGDSGNISFKGAGISNRVISKVWRHILYRCHHTYERHHPILPNPQRLVCCHHHPLCKFLIQHIQ